MSMLGTKNDPTFKCKAAESKTTFSSVQSILIKYEAKLPADAATLIDAGAALLRFMDALREGSPRITGGQCQINSLEDVV